MTSSSKLVIHFENPGVDIKVVNDQPCKSQLKLSPILNIVSTHRDWNITKLENTLGSTLRRVYNISSCLVRLTAHNRHSELNRQFDIVVSNFARNDVCMFTINQILDLS